MKEKLHKPRVITSQEVKDKMVELIKKNQKKQSVS